MLTIGLIGGMSWESSAHYYRLINQRVRASLGGTHSAKIVMVSVDFAAIEQLQHDGDWPALGEAMADAARQAERGAADFLLLCTNTMHKLVPEIEAAVTIPLLHIVDPAAAAIRGRGYARVGLLGTAFTMEERFYRARLEGFGIEVLVPDADDRRTVHDIIYRELVRGVIDDASRDAYRGVIARLVARGAEGIVLGCTEIMLLVGPGDSAVPLFDTTTLHAESAVDRALDGVARA
ncbi:aspartate/glutamate racemase family protein [Sphingomonas oligophenolica]|uniref:Aspartate/glutamate racemase family protein n=1 Tax=Sphingomonas oligophenolica TaxID=301154 RepID=A0A502CA03_9SPHN|nr:aspartate/glutamate racemase family protein [Sphingomonas oligophenolica]TPG10415.1 aspartate/glutamate racemase family protein [Sphingomonas oligophenolica]